MTEQQRILDVIDRILASDDDGEAILRLHEQLPRKLSRSIFICGAAATKAALVADPTLLDEDLR
jgi:glutamine synthetase adenylyltransferase